MEDLYLTGTYVDRNPTYHVEDSTWKAAQVLKMLEKHELRPATVGEVGCGAGEILRQLQLRLPAQISFVGYDISPQAIGLCKTRENERLKFRCGDLLDDDAASFDLLMCMDVFEHISDYLGFLRRLRHKAVHKLFHVPLDLSVSTILRVSPIVAGRRNAGHLHYFVKETALLTLQDTGYDVLDWFYTPVGFDRGQKLQTRLANLPRRLVASLSVDWAARLLGGFSLLVLAK